VAQGDQPGTWDMRERGQAAQVGGLGANLGAVCPWCFGLLLDSAQGVGRREGALAEGGQLPGAGPGRLISRTGNNQPWQMLLARSTTPIKKTCTRLSPGSLRYLGLGPGPQENCGQGLRLVCWGGGRRCSLDSSGFFTPILAFLSCHFSPVVMSHPCPVPKALALY